MPAIDPSSHGRVPAVRGALCAADATDSRDVVPLARRRAARPSVVEGVEEVELLVGRCSGSVTRIAHPVVLVRVVVRWFDQLRTLVDRLVDERPNGPDD